MATPIPGVKWDSELTTAFQQLDSALTNSQNLWRPQPFICDELPWSHTHPKLQAALLKLSDEETHELYNHPPQRLNWFRQQEPALCDALYAYDPPTSDTGTRLNLEPFDSVGIPGRKWQQIVAFAGALPHNDLPLVDWCAGKGHLSRVVARSQRQPVQCLEWDTSLVAVGDALSKRRNLDIRYHQHDVRQVPPPSCAHTTQMHMGLHACGELHHHLLRHVASTNARAVALSPCCYHKMSAEIYQPLSDAAHRSQLILNRATLHLAVQDTVTARRGERRLREQERIWRLGFDVLQRDVRSSDEYLNVPSSRRELLRQDFASFCRWAAKSRQVILPENIAYEQYLELGRKKHRRIVRLDLLRQLFNRPLEMWLVLDCALYLEEHGYRVQLSQFCERQVSPRNLLIQGEKH
jgi:hypothetical protein